MTPAFDGRLVLVTGASKGIGAATAVVFGALGAKVAVHCKSDVAGAARVVESIGGDRAATFEADLGDWASADQLVTTVEERFGPIDHLVLNHGIWKAALIDRMQEGDYDEMFDANLRGVFALSGAAARSMRRSGNAPRSSMVLIASTAGQRGEAGHAHYAATKGAVISLTKSLASELAPDGIRVNCVAPGWVETSMTRGALEDPNERPKILATIPLGRVGRPEEVAHVVAFVASDLASFMTGEIVNVNGGAVLCG